MVLAETHFPSRVLISIPGKSVFFDCENPGNTLKVKTRHTAIKYFISDTNYKLQLGSTSLTSIAQRKSLYANMSNQMVDLLTLATDLLTKQ